MKDNKNNQDLIFKNWTYQKKLNSSYPLSANLLHK